MLINGKLGVSIVVCCHNSATLISTALEHLKAQRLSTKIPWEVLLIDNASTDDTAQVARQCWGNCGPATMRIVMEPRLGLSYARERAFQEARYEIVSFIDDDNWVADDWVEVASDVMSSDLDLGAVGSVNEPVADIPLPAWFDNYVLYYAVLREQEFKLLGHPPWRINGAGMTIRKSACQKLIANGFRPFLSDRKGEKLSCGGDTELTIALSLSGWKLLLEPRLRLKHFLPEHRLNWRYLRRMARSYEASHVALDAYHNNGRETESRLRIRKTWPWHVLGLVKGFLLSPRSVRALLVSSEEGDPEVINAERSVGRIIGMATLRGQYNRISHEVRNASWRLRK